MFDNVYRRNIIRGERKRSRSSGDVHTDVTNNVSYEQSFIKHPNASVKVIWFSLTPTDESAHQHTTAF